MQLTHTHQARGFTLIELMVTIAVLAILVSVGLPSFVNLTRTTAINAATNDLADALRFARSESIQRNATIWVVPKGNYISGWSICVSEGCSAITDKLRAHEESLQSVTLECSGITCTKSLSFTGRGTGDAARFTITHTDDVSMQRCVRTGLSGSVNVSDGACPAG